MSTPTPTPEALPAMPPYLFPAETFGTHITAWGLACYAAGAAAERERMAAEIDNSLMTFRHTRDGMIRGGRYVNVEDVMNTLRDQQPPSAAARAEPTDGIPLDAVIDAYTAETCGAENFDAKVLQSFINRFPQHAAALRRYASMQLTSRPATREEIEAEEDASPQPAAEPAPTSMDYGMFDDAEPAPVAEPAIEKFREIEDDHESGLRDESPLERLRFFCSLAMNGQDWLDVEPFFDALAAPVAPAAASGAVYGIIDPDYGRVYTIARKLAWEEGYAIGLHGSFTRDLDLIAVPWVDKPCEPEHLIRRIIDATGLKSQHDNPGKKPQGRLVWTLLFPGFSDPRFVDLSIMPLATPPAHDAPAEAPKLPALDTMKIVVRDAFMNGLAFMEGNPDSRSAEWREAADWFVTRWVSSEDNPLNYPHECGHPMCGCESGRCAADEANDRVTERLRFNAALATSAPPKALSDEEIEEIARTSIAPWVQVSKWSSLDRFARAIESRLRTSSKEGK